MLSSNGVLLRPQGGMGPWALQVLPEQKDGFRPDWKYFGLDQLKDTHGFS